MGKCPIGEARVCTFDKWLIDFFCSFCFCLGISFSIGQRKFTHSSDRFEVMLCYTFVTTQLITKWENEKTRGVGENKCQQNAIAIARIIKKGGPWTVCDVDDQRRNWGKILHIFINSRTSFIVFLWNSAWGAYLRLFLTGVSFTLIIHFWRTSILSKSFCKHQSNSWISTRGWNASLFKRNDICNESNEKNDHFH